MAGDDKDNDKKLTEEEANALWAQISGQIEVIWAEIIKVTDNVLQAHTKFGFASFANNISPTMEEILLSLRVAESILDAVDASGTLEYSEGRIVVNAKQQILWIQTIANALKYRNETDYLASIEKLGNQSGH